MKLIKLVILASLVTHGLVSPAHSMEVVGRVKRFIKEKLSSAPPAVLCYEAGEGQFENADGSKFITPLIGPTNARVSRVNRYEGSNACYDFYLVDPAQKTAVADKKKEKGLIQVRVYNGSLACENLKKYSNIGEDNELIEPPVSTQNLVLNGAEDKRVYTKSYVYYVNQKEAGKIPSYEAVEVNQGFLLSNKNAGKFANDFRNRRLGKIQFSCGKYSAINNVLYETETLKAIRGK